MEIHQGLVSLDRLRTGAWAGNTLNYNDCYATWTLFFFCVLCHSFCCFSIFFMLFGDKDKACYALAMIECEIRLLIRMWPIVRQKKHQSWCQVAASQRHSLACSLWRFHATNDRKASDRRPAHGFLSSLNSGLTCETETRSHTWLVIQARPSRHQECIEMLTRFSHHCVCV